MSLALRRAGGFALFVLGGAVVAVAAGLYVGASRADDAPQVEQHFAPLEDLERIDVAELRRAQTTIDMSAYVLTDRAVIEALASAARRSVRVRLYRQVEDLEASGVGDAVAALEKAGAQIRYKHPTTPLMHLKAYCVDHSVLRVGAANFSHSGLTQQDNDLELLRGPGVCARFDAAFEAMWGR
jgi:phosphatidylserine/phosphatidylglycerophosphate/cardiolipin synthase-like enzyme